MMDGEDDPLTDADERENEASKPDAPTHDEPEGRTAELGRKRVLKKALRDLYNDVLSGFQDQMERSNDQLDFWDLYNCKLGSKQAYSGNSKIFVPIITNAVNARKTRFTNQIFPQSQRYVEVTTGEEKPTALLSLLEHYVRKARLRTEVMPALLKNGDIEGQYNVYVSWIENTRHVVHRVKRAVEVDQGVPSDVDEEEDIEEETITHAYPHVEVLADADVLLLPATASSVEDALAQGGSATIIRRWSKSRIKQMLADDELDAEGGRAMLKEFGRKQSAEDVDKAKEMTDAAGIRVSAGKKTAQVYETWTVLKIDKERRLCRVYFGGEEIVLGCRRNPYWADKCPLISVPVEKVQGSFKGISKVKPCADMQYTANDAINEGMDSAAYALMPIIMTDPQKNPRVGSMILNLAAIWETSPQDTQFAKFPELWKQAFEIVAASKAEIFQTLSVSPAIMPQSSGGRAKRNQAEIAQEQQVDMLATADAVTVLEEGVLTPLLNRFIELDHQYRDEEITVRQYGEMGLRATMEKIEPVQMGRRYEFRWFGVESARNAQQIQQQIATMNVLRGIPPQQLPGYEINLVPIVSQLVENTFGPRLAPQIFKDLKSKLSIDPQIENEMLLQGFPLAVSPIDDDAQHMQVHAEALRTGDVHGTAREHIMRHQMQQQMKMQAAMAQQQGAPGMPGGAGPGAAGTPRQGAQPGMPRGGQNPPGAIHSDRMRDPRAAPRR